MRLFSKPQDVLDRKRTWLWTRPFDRFWKGAVDSNVVRLRVELASTQPMAFDAESPATIHVRFTGAKLVPFGESQP